jgi:hypothetical protein
MSAMSELYLDIVTMLEEGKNPVTIAKVLDVPLGMIYDVLESMVDPAENLSPFETCNS